MEVVCAGKNEVLKLLASLSFPDGIYKQSQFVIRHETKQGTVIANTISGEIVLLSPEEREAMNMLPSKFCETLAALRLHGYVVPDACDEINRIEQMREIICIRQDSNAIFTHYNILPTTDCNARCFYCYQSGFRHISMSEETARNLIDFILKHHADKKIRISWYGGEPTISLRIIDYICTKLAENGVDFESHMVSNAYLFEPELVKHAKEKWYLSTIQITLDGTEKIYNKTKAYVYAKENAYKRVMRNINSLLDARIHVNIRLNLDEHNGDDLGILIDELTSMFKGNKYLAIYIRKLRENVGFSPIIHNDTERIRLNQKYIELRNQLEENGWSQIWNYSLPCLRIHSCMADDPYSIQCTPDGILSKCEDRIFDYVIGTLEKGITDNETVMWWRQRIMHEECHHCVLYPSCTHLLLHCPVRPSECPTLEKQQRIRMCHQMIDDLFERWLNGIQSKNANNSSILDEVGGMVL